VRSGVQGHLRVGVDDVPVVGVHGLVHVARVAVGELAVDGERALGRSGWTACRSTCGTRGRAGRDGRRAGSAGRGRPRGGPAQGRTGAGGGWDGGPVGSNSLPTRSGIGAAASSRRVRLRRRRGRWLTPAWRISRSTRLWLTRQPRRHNSAVTPGAP
jgi:hypothetical protein